MSYQVYILYSQRRDRYYIGFTDSLENRLRKHNSNHRGFTEKQGDWTIVYKEEFDDKKTAMQREAEIKKWKSRKRVEQLIAQSQAR